MHDVEVNAQRVRVERSQALAKTARRRLGGRRDGRTIRLVFKPYWRVEAVAARRLRGRTQTQDLVVLVDALSNVARCWESTSAPDPPGPLRVPPGALVEPCVELPTARDTAAHTLEQIATREHVVIECIGEPALFYKPVWTIHGSSEQVKHLVDANTGFVTRAP